jgi:hypothetical protein
MYILIIDEILLKVTLNTITLTHYFIIIHCLQFLLIYSVFIYRSHLYFIPTISSDVHVVNKIITIICIDIYMYMLRMLILLLVSIPFEVKNVSSLRSQIFLY